MQHLVSMAYLNLTKNLVLEKEKRLKESMKMMGLQDYMHWLAWFTKYLIWMAITVGIMTILLCIKLRDGVGILNQSDWSLVFVFFLLYGINTIAFSFMVSTIFSKVQILIKDCFLNEICQIRSWSFEI